MRKTIAERLVHWSATNTFMAYALWFRPHPQIDMDGRSIARFEAEVERIAQERAEARLGL